MNRAVDEQQVLFNRSPSNETVRPISRLTEKGVTLLGVSTEKAQKPPPSGSSNSTGTITTAASSDRQQSVTFSTVTALPTAPVPAPLPEIPSLMSEKLNMDLFQWPRIYFSMAKEEDDDDEFIPLKNSGKLPPPPWPKMKPKSSNYLHYCFPGMWLSDLSKGRYEVREKKCVKKKKRGLKGLESMDSGSE